MIFSGQPSSPDDALAPLQGGVNYSAGLEGKQGQVRQRRRRSGGGGGQWTPPSPTPRSLTPSSSEALDQVSDLRMLCGGGGSGLPTRKRPHHPAGGDMTNGPRDKPGAAAAASRQYRKDFDNGNLLQLDENNDAAIAAEDLYAKVSTVYSRESEKNHSRSPPFEWKIK